MRQKMNISVSEEIFTAWLSGRDGRAAAWLPPLWRERAWGLFSLALSNKWEVWMHLHSKCFLVANFVIIWLIVWSAAFPFPWFFWLKIPVLCDTESRHLRPESLSEATFPEEPARKRQWDQAALTHSRDRRSMLGWGWQLFPLLLFPPAAQAARCARRNPCGLFPEMHAGGGMYLPESCQHRRCPSLSKVKENTVALEIVAQENR